MVVRVARRQSCAFAFRTYLIIMARFKIWSNTAEFMSLEDIRPAAMADLHAYWKGAVGDDGPPRQKDISIQGMPPECLEHIALLDFTNPPTKAKYLIIGSALKKLLGADPTGQYIHDVYPESIYTEIHAAFAKAAHQHEALYFRREFQVLNKSFGYDRLIMPLRLDGPTIRRILICIYPLDPKLTSANQWQDEVAKLEDMERRERRFESAWAESLGYKMVTAEDENAADEEDLDDAEVLHLTDPFTEIDDPSGPRKSM
jgi:hypothetical protein